MEWTEEDEEEPDEFGDHDDVTEDSQTVVVDDLSIYEMQQHLEHGDLNVMLPPVVAVVPEVHTAQGESLPSENDVPSGLEAAGSQNQLGGNGVPPPPPPPLADDLSDFLNALGNDDDNEEAVLGLLFQDDEMVTAKADVRAFLIQFHSLMNNKSQSIVYKCIHQQKPQLRHNVTNLRSSKLFKRKVHTSRHFRECSY